MSFWFYGCGLYFFRSVPQDRIPCFLTAEFEASIFRGLFVERPPCSLSSGFHFLSNTFILAGELHYFAMVRKEVLVWYWHRVTYFYNSLPPAGVLAPQVCVDVPLSTSPPRPDRGNYPSRILPFLTELPFDPAVGAELADFLTLAPS